MKKEQLYNSLLQRYEKLQQENERLKEENNKFNRHIQGQGKLISALRDLKNTDYKSKCEKVLQIIKGCKILMPHEFDWEEQIDNIENILQGSDKE